MHEWVTAPKYYENYSSYNKQTATTTLKSLPPRPTQQQIQQQQQQKGSMAKHYAIPTASSSNKQNFLLSKGVKPAAGGAGNGDAYIKQLMKDQKVGVYSLSSSSSNSKTYKNNGGSSKNRDHSTSGQGSNSNFYFAGDQNDLQPLIYDDEGKSKKQQQVFYATDGGAIVMPDGPVLVETYEATDEFGKQFVPTEQKIYTSAKNALSDNNGGVFYYSSNGDDFGTC